MVTQIAAGLAPWMDAIASTDGADPGGYTASEVGARWEGRP